MSRREPRLPRAWRAWIRLLLRAFPPSFRQTLGRDLAAQYHDHPPRTTIQFLRRAGAATSDLVPAGLGARLDDLRPARSAIRRSVGGGGVTADIRYGVRMLTRRPLYGAAIVLTLALASGLATAVFGIFDATLVRPLPFPADDRLVSIGSRWNNLDYAAVSIPEYLDYRAQARSLESTAAYRSISANLDPGGDGPERLSGAAVTASFFDVLGVPPAHGRIFTPEEARPGGEPVAVLAHGLWRRRFGSDPSLVGRTLRIDDQPVIIVGIMPASFRVPAANTEIWVPLRVNAADPGGRGAHNRQVIARLKPGVALAAAADELSAIGEQFARDYPESYPAGSGWGVSVSSLRERLVGDLGAPLQLLFASVLFVLSIAAANTSGLMLARANERRTEFAARAALGASRVRLVRQGAIEGALAGLAGGGLGVVLADVLLRGLEAGLPQAASRPEWLALDVRTVAFGLGVTVSVAATAGTYAALHASRGGAAGALHSSALHSGARHTGGRSVRRVRTGLVVGQLALAFVLLIGSGLSIRSFGRLLRVDPGLSTAGVSTARLSVPATRYRTGRDVVAFYERLLDAVAAAPGVRDAGAVSILPLSGSDSDVNFGVEGFVPPVPGPHPNAQARFVAGSYFRALGIPLVRGRFFSRSDHPDAPFVAIASEALARKYWPGTDPIGRRMKMWSLDDDGPWRTVVGVVGDVRHYGLGEAAPPILYLPVSQFSQRTLTVVVRAQDGPSLPRVIQDHVRALDPSQPVYDSRTMDAWVETSIAQPRFSLLMLTIFAAAAVALAALGIYGVMAFTVASRARELGIRVALGAEPRALMRSILGRGLLLAAGGMAAGTAGALLASRSLTALLYGAEPLEPLVYAVAAIGLGSVALVACALPARRVLRLDPTAALRAE